jgi:hypothetical protein
LEIYGGTENIKISVDFCPYLLYNGLIRGNIMRLKTIVKSRNKKQNLSVVSTKTFDNRIPSSAKNISQMKAVNGHKLLEYKPPEILPPNPKRKKRV